MSYVVQSVDEAVVMSFVVSGRGRWKVGKGKESFGDLGAMFEFRS